MAGKKGRSGRKRKPKPIEEVFKKNEERIPELVEIAYKLATDDSVSERDRIKATDLIIEKALPKSAQGPSRDRMVLDADEMLEYFDKPMEKMYKEQKRLIREYFPNESLEDMSPSRQDELIPILEIRVNMSSRTAEADFKLPSGEVITRRS